MKCPVCGKDAAAHIVHCNRCAVYVHDKCWAKHVKTAHKEK